MGALMGDLFSISEVAGGDLLVTATICVLGSYPWLKSFALSLLSIRPSSVQESWAWFCAGCMTTGT